LNRTPLLRTPASIRFTSSRLNFLAIPGLGLAEALEIEKIELESIIDRLAVGAELNLLETAVLKKHIVGGLRQAYCTGSSLLWISKSRHIKGDEGTTILACFGPVSEGRSFGACFAPTRL